MAFKCSGVEITPEALKRVSMAAHEWSERQDLTLDERKLARALEDRASRLAASPAATSNEIAVLKQLCCHLFSIVNRGGRPGPSAWPCAPRRQAAGAK